MTDPFAPFAEIYDSWVASAPVTVHHVPFYADEFARATGPCVELGVGNGRITIEAAKRGADITGVDISPAMLRLCRERAEAAGVSDRIRLIESDFRAFRLAAPAALVAIPFHTLGHMVTLDDKAALFRHVHDVLAPGGRFVFDMFVFNPTYAAANANMARLRAEFHDPATDEDVAAWECVRYDVPRQTMRVVAWADRLDADGFVRSRRYARMDFSWIDPPQVEERLVAAGFEVENAWGGFDRRPLTPESKLQVWSARRK